MTDHGQPSTTGRVNNHHVADSTPDELLASLDRLIKVWSTGQFPGFVSDLRTARRDLEHRHVSGGAE